MDALVSPSAAPGAPDLHRPLTHPPLSAEGSVYVTFSLIQSLALNPSDTQVQLIQPESLSQRFPDSALTLLSEFLYPITDYTLSRWTAPLGTSHLSFSSLRNPTPDEMQTRHV